MSPTTPRRSGKHRHSHPSTPSPLISPNAGRSSTKPLSPESNNRKIRQPLHIRMNLTETQVDRITDAFTRHADESPLATRSNNTGRQRPASHQDTTTTHTADMTFQPPPPTPPRSLAERRHRVTPAPIHTGSLNRRATASHRIKREHVSVTVSPLSPRQMYEASNQDDADPRDVTPFYIDYQYKKNQPEPLRLPKDRYPDDPCNNASRSQNAHNTGRNSDSRQDPPANNVQGQNTPFSPFPFYFRSKHLPDEKRGGKVLIGEKGWLQRTEDDVPEPRSSPTKRTGILHGIKRMAKDMVSAPQPAAASTSSIPAISLDAREQSLLYGELEFHLTDALNTYITKQLDKGRLLPDKFNKVADTWRQQGRSRVVGFRYDLQTQIRLVALHIDEFSFSGRRRGNRSQIADLLQAADDNSQEMRVRTFCQPDVVIARHLVGARSLLNLLGVGGTSDAALAEAAHFFKVCVARERGVVEKESYRAHISRVEHRRRRDESQVNGCGSSSNDTQQEGRRDASSGDDEWLFYPN